MAGAIAGIIVFGLFVGLGLTLLNRVATGLPQLAIDPLAESAAQTQAKDMETAGIMRHTDSFGRSPYERFKSDGGFASLYGENVAYFGLDVNDLQNEWQAVLTIFSGYPSRRPIATYSTGSDAQVPPLPCRIP